MANAKDLFSALWAAADEMRAKMSADAYKDYLLGLVFYKSLSDKYLSKVADELENRKDMQLAEAQKLYEKVEKDGGDDWTDICQELQDSFGCFIRPEYTFSAFYNQINSSEFRLEKLKQAFREVEKSQGATYDGLFDDFDIQSKDLGKTPMECNMTISAVIKALADINFSEYGDDALGDAYEYLIAQFASESGKKAGEFYTPQAVSRIIAKIVTSGREKKEGFSIYDPCCGSGSLLLQVKSCMYKEGQKDFGKFVQFFGQEINNQTYNLARMNMMLHQISPQNQHLNNGDTLSTDWPVDEPTNFDACAMNPPYSLKWNALDSLLTDNRFQHYEKLAPKSTADYAFLLHGFYHLKTDGVMGIVLPHGVLFRGAAEGVIRKHLVEDGSIYAVIGLPSGLFFNTGIPTCIIILKKNNTNRDILFIDASNDFVKEKAKNYLTEEHIEKILKAYTERKDIEKYAHLASFEEIKENDYNLNIPRYVDTSEEEEQIDLSSEFNGLYQIEEESEKIAEEINLALKELGIEKSISSSSKEENKSFFGKIFGK